MPQLKLKYLLSLSLLTISLFSLAQDSENVEEEGYVYKHTITISGGRATRLDEHEGFIPKSVGADYLYRIKPKWELGIQGDLDFDDQNSEPDLVVGVGVVSYSITDKWPVFGGVGFESRLQQPGETLPIIRIGTEYTFPIGQKQHFAILPGTFVDVNKHGASPSFILAVGYFFGEF